MELMEGLTVLSTEVQDPSIFYLILILPLIGFVVMVFLTIICMCDDLIGPSILCIIAVLCFMLIGFFCVDKANDPPTTVYKVTIDDTVSMVEFYERYEVLDQEGLIFTITEKEK